MLQTFLRQRGAVLRELYRSRVRHYQPGAVFGGRHGSSRVEAEVRLPPGGGGVDTQKTLPFGTPQEVRDEVLRRCEIFAPGGGFVFNSIHNLQAGTPVENIVAMLDAVHEFNGVSHG